jgi:Haem-binding domain
MIVGAFAIQIARPARTNPPTDPSRTMAVIARVPPPVQNVLERGCRDCHSNDTRWPWYSNVAPVSWLVIDDVNHGRRHFNYSDWAQYDEDKIPKLLKDICELTRKQEMPLPIYLWLHPGARLSDRDIATLCDWSTQINNHYRDPLATSHRSPVASR